MVYRNNCIISTKDIFLLNETFKAHTTFSIGGRIKYFFEPKSLSEFIHAIDYAKNNNLQFKVIGNGSNILASDNDYDGLVICTKKLKKLRKVGGGIIAYTGLMINDFLYKVACLGYGGLETLAGIPATIGGAITMNASAFGDNISKYIDSICVYENGVIKKLTNKECGFAYRNSIFRNNDSIILFAKFNLPKEDIDVSRKKITDFLKLRSEKQPVGYSCGSVFKNPLGYNAGMLIESLLMKGERVGGAVISKKHANFIINDKDAKASDVYSLINMAKRKVKNIFNIDLEREVEFIGEISET